VLAGCGGGAGGGGGGTTTPSTFNLAQGLANFAKGGSTKTFTISGSCTGRLVITNTPVTSTAMFEGVTRFVGTTNQKITFNVPCSAGLSSDITITNYYDSNYWLSGYVDPGIQGVPNSGSYAVFRGAFTPPISVQVGDSGVIGTLDLYSNASKASKFGTADYSYKILAGSSSNVIVSIINVVSTNGNFTGNETINFSLDTNGQMTRLSVEETGTFSPGNGTNYHWVAN